MGVTFAHRRAYYPVVPLSLDSIISHAKDALTFSRQAAFFLQKILSPEARRASKIDRLLSWVGRIRRDLMREPSDPQYPALLRRAKKFGRATVDFHNMDTSQDFSPSMPADAASPPPEASSNTREGHTVLVFWLEVHRQHLLSKRDGESPRRRRRLPDERHTR